MKKLADLTLKHMIHMRVLELFAICFPVESINNPIPQVTSEVIGEPVSAGTYEYLLLLEALKAYEEVAGGPHPLADNEVFLEVPMSG